MVKANSKTLDVTGLLCPMPVLRTRRALDTMQAGDTLIVTASDPASIHDMPAFCKLAGHTLVMAREVDEMIIFEVEKGSD